MKINWPQELPIAITVTDRDGKIVEMNNKSAEVFAKYGGQKLIGQQLNNCHNPQSQATIARLTNDNATNVYTIEKNGQKKLIYQCPWYNNGEFGGLVELSMVIPEEMPHFIR
ncbi:MAG: PAS domain-containing protein [Bacteroidota bacterium]